MAVDLLLANAFFLCEDPVEQRLMEPYFPLGMLYIAATLREAGYRVEIFDGCFASGEQDFLAALERSRPRLVGVNALNTTRRMALRLGRLARERGYPVVFGGADPTSRPEGYILSVNGQEPAADLVVVGEGEETILHVARHFLGEPRAAEGRSPRSDFVSRTTSPHPSSNGGGSRNAATAVEDTERPSGYARRGYGPGVTVLPLVSAAGGGPDRDGGLGSIAGIAYRNDAGEMATTAKRPPIADTDALSFPAWDLIDLEQYRRVWTEHHGAFSLSLITSRGCPFGCNWCAKPVFGRAYRLRSPENVVAEMLMLKERFQPDAVRIVDDIFGLNRRWLASWHQETLRRGSSIPFECLSRTELLTPTTLQQLKEAGCRKIFFGAESGSQNVLDAMNKGNKVGDALEAARLMREHGLKSHFYIMVGYPGEEPADIQKTVALLREAAPDTMSVSVAYPLPGTEFYEMIKERLLPEHDWSYSSENSLLFRRERHSTRYYRWVERLLQKEWAVARWRYAGAPPLGRRLRLLAEREICRAAVWVLGKLPQRTLPFRVASSGR